MITRMFYGDDIYFLNRWRVARGLLEIKPDELPSIGIVVFHQKEPIAMGFLRECEGSFGILDSMITNPENIPEERNEAMDLVFRELINASDQYGINTLIGFSVDDNTMIRAEKYGFKKSDHVLMSRGFK